MASSSCSLGVRTPEPEGGPEQFLGSIGERSGVEPGIKHLGPVAQDFHAAPGVGPDDKHIATVDEGGAWIISLRSASRMGPSCFCGSIATASTTQGSEESMSARLLRGVELAARFRDLCG